MAISDALSERCNCPFSQNDIADVRFSCVNGPNANSVLVHGSLISSEEVDSVELLLYMQEWLLTEPTIALDGVSLHATENCHIYANTTYDSCEWLPNTIRENHIITIEIAAGIGLVALIALMAFVIVLVVCIFQRKKQQRKPM